MNKSKLFRSIVFDLDGTLLDTLPSLTLAVNEVFVAAGGRAVDPACLRSPLSEGLHIFFQNALSLQPFAEDEVVGKRLEMVFFEHYERQHLLSAQPYGAVGKAVTALRAQGVRLAICTNRTARSARTLLAHIGLASHFDAVVGLGDVAEPKPSAEPLYKAMALLDTPAAEALLVGDSRIDARCAAAAGVAFAAHTGGYACNRSDLQPQVLSFDRFEDFVEYVLGRPCGTEEFNHA